MLRKKQEITKRLNDRGDILVQLGVYLAILAILVAAAVHYLPAIMHNGKTAALRTQIDGLISVGHAYGQSNSGNPLGPYYGIGAYGSNVYSSAYALLPNTYGVGGAGVGNDFGGRGIITNPVTENYQMFSVVESGLPTDVCTNLASSYGADILASCSGSTLTLTTE